jgi:DNA-binding transcriptional regulator YiaG
MNKKYKSEAMMVTHEAMKDLFDAGIIDATQMGAFDAMCLVPRCLVPETSVIQEAKSSSSPSVPVNPYRAYALKAD